MSTGEVLATGVEEQRKARLTSRELTWFNGPCRAITLIFYRNVFYREANTPIHINLGAGPWQVFKSVTLPMARPGLTSAILITAIYILEDFGNPALIAGRYGTRSRSAPYVSSVTTVPNDSSCRTC